jgi:hypothetical protein
MAEAPGLQGNVLRPAQSAPPDRAAKQVAQVMAASAGGATILPAAAGVSQPLLTLGGLSNLRTFLWRPPPDQLKLVVPGVLG